MKIVLMLFILLSSTSIISARESTKYKDPDKIIHATCEGHYTEGFYSIKKGDKRKMLFVRISPLVLMKFDLMDDSSVGKLFEVSYDLEKVGGEDQPVIINLEIRYKTDIEDN